MNTRAERLPDRCLDPRPRAPGGLGRGLVAQVALQDRDSRLDAELSRATAETVDLAGLLRTLVEIEQANPAPDGPCFALDIEPNESLLVAGIEGRIAQIFRNLTSRRLRELSPGPGPSRPGPREGGA